MPSVPKGIVPVNVRYSIIYPCIPCHNVPVLAGFSHRLLLATQQEPEGVLGRGRRVAPPEGRPLAWGPLAPNKCDICVYPKDT